MKAWAGWIAAVLLVALAFTSGPDVLDPSPPVAQVTAGETGDRRDPRVRGDVTDTPEATQRIEDRGTPGHPRLAALPPSSQTVAPIPVRGAPQAIPRAAPAAPTDLGARPHRGACTPEALQIFRC